MKQARRKHNLKKKGLSLVEYDARLLSQKGVCAICLGQPKGQGAKEGSFHVDHDHVTGKIRGLLCHSCNTALGHLQDSPALLRKAALYLEDAKNTSTGVIA